MSRLAAAAVVLCALAAAAPASAQRLETWSLHSGYIDTTKVAFSEQPPPGVMRVNVLLPDGYDGRRRFPVLYLLHGHGDAYDTWSKPGRGDVAQIAKGLPAIVVMPEGGRGWYTNWWSGGLRAPAWESWFLDEVIPTAERRLRIRHGRRWHAIAGLSMGGEGAMYFASQLPGYFGSAASFSGCVSIQRSEWPAGFNSQGENYDTVYGPAFYATGHNPTALVGNLRATRLFVAVGDGTNSPDVLAQHPELAVNGFGGVAEVDLRQHADDFTKAAKAAGDDVTYMPQQGIHDWPYWRKHLADAIRWGFFGPVPASLAKWSYETVQRRGEAWGYHFLFSSPPGTVETLKRNGRMLSGGGSGTVRVRTPSGRRFTATLPFSRRLPR